jgi:hypothetical protein
MEKNKNRKSLNTPNTTMSIPRFLLSFFKRLMDCDCRGLRTSFNIPGEEKEKKKRKRGGNKETKRRGADISF